MLKIKHHILYKKDFKKLVKNGFDDSVLNEVILRKKEPLPPPFKDHALKGVWKPYRECHIKRQLFNFLNSIKTKQKRALEKIERNPNSKAKD
ncbi:type II toxin-antitoxin system YafQ family toxin [Helicobacter pylori]|uniref:type II toxin-antitoxin system RelE/ParE family toxin n=1 Tax=Helicobacter pylori TaxID=210 RepID=UPI000675DEB9|nr:type II toxin-antitoxin system YafQ family toxin [Helicobacter pylori]